jgi:TrmH family RNA methyltransferase
LSLLLGFAPRGKQLEWAAVETRASLENLRIVLVATRNPLNIGAAARAMSNFGAPHLRLVSPYSPAFREARSAVGASAVLATAAECESIAGAIADCSLVVGTTAIGNRELQHPLYTLDRAAPLIHKHLRSGRVALLFGSEKWGLSNEALSHCHWLLHIPTRREHESMNLGQAVAVCLYELVRRPVPAAKALSPPPAELATVDRVTSALLETLQSSGYVKPRAASAEAKLRRMIRRLHLQESDAKVFLGMLRKILWKLRLGP